MSAHRGMKGLLLLLASLGPLQASTADELPKVDTGQLVRHNDFPSSLVPPRHVDVWLPPGYSSSVAHAVLYMHDGQMLFDASQTWNGQEWRVDEVAGELLASGQLRPFIVVGVHNAGVDRSSEYLPQQVHEALADGLQERLAASRRQDRARPPRPVASDAYLRFLIEELKPFVDQHYAVSPQPEDTLLMGSSMGGLISLYALSERPDVFGAAACLSTHWPLGFVLDEDAYPQAMLDYVARRIPDPALGRRVYFDYGDATLDAAYPPWQQLVDSIMLDRGYTYPQWQTHFFPGAEHSERAWASRLAIPLQFLLGRSAAAESATSTPDR